MKFGRPRVLSFLRIVTALLYLQSGLVKFFDFPVAGPPLAGLIVLAAILETFGSLLLLVGLFTRPVAYILSAQAKWPLPISSRTCRSRSSHTSTAAI